MVPPKGAVLKTYATVDEPTIPSFNCLATELGCAALRCSFCAESDKQTTATQLRILLDPDCNSFSSWM